MDSQRSDRTRETHSGTILEQLKSNLASTTQSFKQVLQTRTKNLKVQQERRGQFGSQRSLALGKPVQRVRSSEYSSTSNTDSPGPSLPRPIGVDSPADAHKASMQNSLIAMPLEQTQLISQQQYLSSRTDAVQEIESYIAELGSIFNRLSEMIHGQGQLVNRLVSVFWFSCSSVCTGNVYS